MIFLSQLKTFMKNFMQERKVLKLPLMNFLVKFLTKKISNRQLNHCEANNFLEKVAKSINSQTNVESLGNDSSKIL